ncbi:Mss4-like protein [Dendryphion nanum]|uniref:Mss4-like protein n=1 Tax=Dendryphion nanum TaxID=256645 RepID=A0A9P9D388_9PLEO|nr:Mss4-like protein [Dendryphion nanum]
MLHGSCLCGSIKYEMHINVPKTSACQCRVCRKITSGTTSLNLVVPHSSFKLMKGTPKSLDITHFDEGFDITLAFCGDCGSAIPIEAYLGEATAREYIIQVGTLDNTGPLEAVPAPPPKSTSCPGLDGLNR